MAAVTLGSAVGSAAWQLVSNLQQGRPAFEGVGAAAVSGATAGATWALAFAGGEALFGRLAARSALGTSSGLAGGASGFAIPEGEIVLAVVHEGKVIAAGHGSISHAAFVERTIGTLPAGARVVTAGRYQGQITALNSRTFHGNQLPAPMEV